MHVTSSLELKRHRQRARSPGFSRPGFDVLPEHALFAANRVEATPRAQQRGACRGVPGHGPSRAMVREAGVFVAEHGCARPWRARSPFRPLHRVVADLAVPFERPIRMDHLVAPPRADRRMLRPVAPARGEQQCRRLHEQLQLENAPKVVGHIGVPIELVDQFEQRQRIAFEGRRTQPIPMRRVVDPGVRGELHVQPVAGTERHERRNPRVITRGQTPDPWNIEQRPDSEQVETVRRALLEDRDDVLTL